MKKKAAIIT